jgi:hypothetical protein
MVRASDAQDQTEASGKARREEEASLSGLEGSMPMDIDRSRCGLFDLL